MLGVKILASEQPEFTVTLAGWSQRSRPGLCLANTVIEAAAIIAVDRVTMH